jgi:WD40 repeat protein
LLDTPGGAMAVSPDGRTLAVLNDAAGSTVHDPIALVDLTTGRIRNHVIGLIGVAAAFSPDGSRLAVAGRFGEVLFLDPATGTAVAPAVVGHVGGATGVVFAADGRTAVTGGRDGRVALWDGRSGEALGGVTVAAPDVATYPGFLPDGRTAIAVASDGSIHTWDTDPGYWLRFACELAGRDLTRAEWADTIGARPYEPTCP